MSADRIVATYIIESPLPLERAAEVLAGEQSSGTFVAIPGETDELRERFRARVERITELEPVSSPSLPGSSFPSADGVPPSVRRGEVMISFPLENVGHNLPTLLSTVAGNLFELRELSGVRLVDLDLPESFARAYPGPQFGVSGTRRLCGVYERPIIGTIVKPSIGLSPAQTARLVGELAAAGIDFIKDDELMANPPHSPLADRVHAVMEVIHEMAERTGKKVMYAFNITDDLDAMLRHQDTVAAAGGSCVMASLNSVGLAGLVMLRRRSQLPIHGHRNGWGMLTRHPALGLGFRPYQTLWRLAGVDHLHCNGIRNKFWEPDDSVVESVRACLAPAFGAEPVMPVISSGQWGGQAPETFRRLESTDLMYLAGGGIMAHPGGPRAGVAAIQQAWEAAVAGVPLEVASRTQRELREALATFGSRR